MYTVVYDADEGRDWLTFIGMFHELDEACEWIQSHANDIEDVLPDTFTWEQDDTGLALHARYGVYWAYRTEDYL